MKATIAKDFELGTWNHRVIRHVCKAFERERKAFGGKRPMLEIVEMHYHANGDIRAHGDVSLYGEDIAELEQTLHRMMRAVRIGKKSPRAFVVDCLCDAPKKKSRPKAAKRKRR